MKQYIVDAFTPRVFQGNPAAVCVLENGQWLEEELMKHIALENNLSETAFLLKENDGYRLRWFTPACEVGLCGHATLASGFIILNYFEPKAEKVNFYTLAGMLTVSRKGEMFEMQFPNIPLERVKVTQEMIENLGTIPLDAWMGNGLDLICVLADDDQVKSFTPDFQAINKMPGRMVHITAPGSDGFDCCSRCFGPKVGVNEDPVCGSAHCQIGPYWAKRLGKKVIRAWEASPRGGEVEIEILNDEYLLLRGHAALFAETILHI